MLIGILAIGAAVLTTLALDHVRSVPTDGEHVAPVPTYSQPSEQSSAPTPAPTTPAAASYDRSEERFLAAGWGVMWRGTAGQCGSAEPTLERSADGGESWEDVAPRYLGIGQLLSLNPFADGQAEIIAAMGADCEIQTLRTFTQGQFWESYPDVLAASYYVDAADPSQIIGPDGGFAAPCPDARGLRTGDGLVAATCGGAAFVRADDDTWRQLPATGAAALTISDGDVVVAQVDEACSGLALARYSGTGAETATQAGCAADSVPSAPTTIALSDQRVHVWSGPDWDAVAE